MAEWDEFPLDRLYHFSSGLSKPRSAFGSGYPFLTFKDVFYNHFVPNNLTELVNSTERERALCSIERGDVFLTRTSENVDDLGMSCVALQTYEGATFNGFTKRLRPKPGVRIVPEFAAYYFRSPRFRRAVTAMASLSTRASLNNQMLSRLMMPLPPLHEQMSIARVLKALDDKIELNRRTNETLGSIGRALFNSWFVDFDPVRAKAGGRDPGYPQPIADLFPDTLEDSELGDLPFGWHVGQFGDFLTQRSERVGDREAMVLSAVSSGRLVSSDAHFTKRVYSQAIGKYLLVRQWDYAYNPSRINIGSVGMLEERVVGAVSPVYVVARPKPAYRWFLRFVLDQPSTREWINTLASGSVRQSLPYRDFASIPCVIPPERLTREFDSTWLVLRAAMHVRFQESRTLAELRDELLPRIISGELRVWHSERMLEAARQ